MIRVGGGVIRQTGKARKGASFAGLVLSSRSWGVDSFFLMFELGHVAVAEYSTKIHAPDDGGGASSRQSLFRGTRPAGR